MGIVKHLRLHSAEVCALDSPYVRHSHVPLSLVYRAFVELVCLVPVLDVPHGQPFLQGVQVRPGATAMESTVGGVSCTRHRTSSGPLSRVQVASTPGFPALFGSCRVKMESLGTTLYPRVAA